MKKVIVTCFLSLLYSLAFSQFYLNLSLRELGTKIRKDLGLTEFKMNFKTNLASWRDDGSETSFIAHFNKENRTDMIMWIPDDKKGLNEYIEMFNKQFVQLNDGEWTHYQDNNFYSIKLNYETYTRPMILFTKKE